MGAAQSGQGSASSGGVHSAQMVDRALELLCERLGDPAAALDLFEWLCLRCAPVMHMCGQSHPAHGEELAAFHRPTSTTSFNAATIRLAVHGIAGS